LKILGVKIGLALLLDWAFGIVFGVILHVLMEIIFEHLKQRIMKVVNKTIIEKIWCGALGEVMV
jgi:hypothetical protein